MLIPGLEAIDMNWHSILHCQDTLSITLPHLSLKGIFLAQQISDTNVIGQMQDAFNHFIASGQVWALIIGFVIGYVVRGLTAS
jgi:hypothetical protein